MSRQVQYGKPNTHTHTQKKPERVTRFHGVLCNNSTLKFHLTSVISQLEIKQCGIHYHDEINLDEHFELLTQ